MAETVKKPTCGTIPKKSIRLSAATIQAAEQAYGFSAVIAPADTKSVPATTTKPSSMTLIPF